MVLEWPHDGRTGGWRRSSLTTSLFRRVWYSHTAAGWKVWRLKIAGGLGVSVRLALSHPAIDDSIVLQHMANLLHVLCLSDSDAIFLPLMVCSHIQLLLKRRMNSSTEGRVAFEAGCQADERCLTAASGSPRMIAPHGPASILGPDPSWMSSGREHNTMAEQYATRADISCAVINTRPLWLIVLNLASAVLPRTGHHATPSDSPERRIDQPCLSQWHTRRKSSLPSTPFAHGRSTPLHRLYRSSVAHFFRTYLAKRRLSRALAALPSDCPVAFTVEYKPYQLFPEASQEGEGKYEWYKRSKYGNSEEKMKMYIALMTAYGETEGIRYKFGGTVANTLQAHRVIQHFQETKGPEVADKLIDSLYRQYFEEEKHPSSAETLLSATSEAGIDEREAKPFVEDPDDGLMDVKMAVREQAGNAIDSVPHVVIEGKRRDITLIGCKEVDEYRKALEQIIKESR